MCAGYTNTREVLAGLTSLAGGNWQDLFFTCLSFFFSNFYKNIILIISKKLTLYFEHSRKVR